LSYFVAGFSGVPPLCGVDVGGARNGMLPGAGAAVSGAGAAVPGAGALGPADPGVIPGAL
jgi:hypothetical protein